MFSYVYKNNKKINKNNLLNILLNNYHLSLIDQNNHNVVLGNQKMLIDMDKKYINILLFDDATNINGIRNCIAKR